MSSTNTKPVDVGNTFDEAKRDQQKCQRKIIEKVLKEGKMLKAEQAKAMEQTKKYEDLKVIAANNLSLEVHYKTRASHELQKLRELSQRTYESTCDIKNSLKSCEKDRTECEINLSSFTDEFNKFKIKSNEQLMFQEDKIGKIQDAIDGNEKLYKNVLEEIETNLISSKTLFETEEIELKNIYEHIEKMNNNCCELKLNLENIKSLNHKLSAEYSERNQCKDSLLTDVNNSNIMYENKIADLKGSIEEMEIQYRNANEETENLQGTLSTENKALENVSIDIKKNEEQLHFYKDQCLQLEEKINESENNFIEEKNKFNDINDINNSITKKEHKYNEVMLLKQQMETDLHELNNKLQLQISTNELLEFEIEKLQRELNDSLVTEQTSIQALAMQMPCVYNELINLQVKLNDIEIKKSQNALENEREINKTENDLQMLLGDTNSKCKKISEEINALKLEMEIVVNEEKLYNEKLIEYQTQFQQILKENDECSEEIKQLKIDFESKTLECTILERKLRLDKILLCRHLPPKRQADYMSDSSTEGAMTMDEFRMKHRKK